MDVDYCRNAVKFCYTYKLSLLCHMINFIFFIFKFGYFIRKRRIISIDKTSENNCPALTIDDFNKLW